MNTVCFLSDFEQNQMRSARRLYEHTLLSCNLYFKGTIVNPASLLQTPLKAFMVIAH